jgi:hypothetical protein
LSEYADLIRVALATATPNASSANYRAACPVCVFRVGSADRHRALSIRIDTGAWFCWRCKAKGLLSGMTYLADQRPEEKADGPTEAETQPEHFYLLSDPENDGAFCLEDARDYLLRRGVGPEMWAAYHIGACTQGKWQGRIIIPFRRLDGSWWGYVGRTWVRKAELAYLYPSGMERRLHFYNEAALLIDTDRPVYVTEGAFDAMAMTPDGIAVLGMAAQQHVEILARTKRPIVVLLDPDARRDARHLMFRLRRRGARAVQIDLPPGCDPDEVERGWIEEEGRQALRELAA